MPGPLSEKLPLRYILVHGKAATQSEAMKEVSRLLEQHPGVKDFTLLMQDLEEREKLESTCLGNELALPHARTEAVREMVLAAGAFPDGVQAESGQTVRLVFVIGTPTGEVTDYLTAVGSLARIMKAETTRRRLATAKNQEEFLHVFREAESEI
jgi:mannitol/fructose-specific phosphotransferase system IIA component (Ntr-type)